jgi:polyhydroxyalkanoate synthesis regulator phasin
VTLVKFELKDWIALLGAALTVGSVLWKGGEITSQLQATTQAVREMAPVVNRLDATTAKLEVQADANKSRIDDLTKRVENLEARRQYYPILRN